MSFEKNVSIKSGNNLSLSGSNVEVTGSLYGSAMSGTTGQFTSLSASSVRVNNAYTLPTSDGTTGQVISTNGSGELTFSSVSAGSSPGGPDTSVQFNKSSTLSGSSNLTYDYTTGVLSGTLSSFTQVSASYIDLGYPSEIAEHEQGRLYYDDSNNRLKVQTEISSSAEGITEIALGQQLAVRVKNVSGVSLAKGKIVHISGSTNSDTPHVTTASYESDSVSADTLGVLMSTVAANDTGYALLYGVLTGIDLSSYAVGDMLYLSSSGDFTTTTPQSPLHEVRIGQITRAQNNGAMFVRIQNGYETDELHDVLFSSKAEGDLIAWDNATGVWRNTKTLSGSYTVTSSNDISLQLVGGAMSFGKPANGSNTEGRYISIEGNTDGSGEGSGRIFFSEHNSTLAAADNYGFSIGYRGGSTAINTALGNSCQGGALIGNGEWAMWGHNNNLNGKVIMYGDRAATFVNFSGSNLYTSGTLNAATLTASNAEFTTITADTITAREYHTELVSASIIYQSGSTKFGDDANDIHQFSGSIRQSGSTLANYFLGSLAVGDSNPASYKLYVNGTSRFADSIVASGILYANDHIYLNTGKYLRSIDTVRVDIDTDNNQTDRVFVVSKDNAATDLFTVQEDGNVGIGTTSPSKKLHVYQGSDGEIRFEGGSSTEAKLGVVGGTPFVGSNGSLKILSSNTQAMFIDSSQNILIGSSGSPSAKLDVSGSTIFGRLSSDTHEFSGSVNVSGTLTATAKSFDIEHPTKEGMRLRYGSLEGAENGVYVRGMTTGSVIELPEHWTGLVDEETITVNLTPYGTSQQLWVKKIEDNKVYIGGKLNKCFFTVFGERKDIDKLVVEY